MADRRLVVAGTDDDALDTLKGGGDEKAFNQRATPSGEREINASSKKELMAQIGSIHKNVTTVGGLKTAAPEDAKSATERWAAFKDAFNSKDTKQFQIHGEVMSDEIWETLGREGFTNKLFALQDIGKGPVDRVRIRKKDVIAWQVTSDVKIQEVRVRQYWVYPPEFYLQCFILIEDKEIEQSTADMLDEKFQDGLEAILVKEDRITKALLDKGLSVYNDPIFYTTFNPSVLTTLRTSVRRWGTPPAQLTLAFDVWDDIIADPDFVAFWDPVLKHELILEGNLGSFLGMQTWTDGFRYPTLQVLQAGDVYVTSVPNTLGSKVIRKELDSRAVDQYNIGRAARGWFLHMIEALVLVNARGVSGAKRLAVLAS